MLTVIFNYIKFFSIIIAASIAIEMRSLLSMLMFMAVCTAVLSTQSKETGGCSPWNGKVRASDVKLIKYTKRSTFLYRIY